MVSETKHTVSAVFVLLEFESGRTPEQVGVSLSHNGVAKGTISKMQTVLRALQSGAIQRSDVTSLNAGYEAATAAREPVQYEYAFGGPKLYKPGQLRVLQTYQSIEQAHAVPENKLWRRRVGPWERIES